MKCPHCNSDDGTKVLETRDGYRRRRCLECCETFVTVERVAEKNSIPGTHAMGDVKRRQWSTGSTLDKVWHGN